MNENYGLLQEKVQKLWGSISSYEQEDGYIWLQLSLGKDSMLLLQLLEEHPDRPKVKPIIVDTGDMPEPAMKLLQHVQANHPATVVIKADSIAYRRRYGDPFDIQLAGMPSESNTPFQCCYRNIMQPMHAFMCENAGVTALRGAKKCDNVMPSETIMVSTFEAYGIINPLFSWTDEEVMQALRPEYTLPWYGAGAKSGLDCLTCTGYISHNHAPYLRVCEPEVYEVYKQKLMFHTQKIKDTLDNCLAFIDETKEQK